MDAIGSDGFGLGLLVAALLLGLRHGVDWDHIAALTDISASQDEPRSGFKLGAAYILGHAAVVIILGIVAISVGATVPAGLDGIMGRLVGVTLIAMGIYIVVSMVTRGVDFKMRSRWMLLFAGIGWTARQVRRLAPAGSSAAHDHRHAAMHHAGDAPEAGADARSAHSHEHTHAGSGDYGVRTATGIGLLHGVGAETPTQVVIFLAAANAGGLAAGLAVLVAFVVGLIVSNTGLNAASTYGFLAAGRSPRIRMTIGAATAAISVVLGVTLLIGADAVLPALLV